MSSKEIGNNPGICPIKGQNFTASDIKLMFEALTLSDWRPLKFKIHHAWSFYNLMGIAEY
jgi:hypothetical protein